MSDRMTGLLVWGVVLFSWVFVRAGEQLFVQKLEGTDVSFKMVPVPAGTFLMGSEEKEKGRDTDEGPRHEVKVEAFFMEEHEVTWEEYNLFLGYYNVLSSSRYAPVPQDRLADAVTFPTPMYDPREGPMLQRMGGRRPNMPAVLMSQFAARQYTKWLSKKTGRFYRLPSEAEWEYAARAGTGTAYSFGDDASKLGDFAWYKGNSQQPDGQPGYHAVMTKKPNPWGLYDMYGNVMEWCVDLYEPNASSKFGKSAEGPDAVVWPGLTKTPYPRVLRGGSYVSDAEACRSAYRMASGIQMNEVDPHRPRSPHWLADAPYVGFRLVSPMREPGEDEKHKWWDADDSTTLTTIERDRERKAIISPGAVDR